MKNNIKKSKILMFIPSLITSLIMVPSIGVLASWSTLENTNSKIASDVIETNPTSDTKPLIPSVANMYNPKLSSKNGPIVFWEDTITSLDWFGAKRWSIDVTSININSIQPFVVNGSSNTAWKRAWLNFDLDKVNDILYILSNAKRGNYQYAVAINVQTGQVTNCYQTAQVVPSNANINFNAFFMLKVLNDGNLAFLGRPGNVGGGTTDTIDVVDIKSGTTKRYDGNITNEIAPLPVAETGSGHNYSLSNNAIFNLIPIAPNRNLLGIYNLTSKTSTGDAGAVNGTSQVWFILVDDQLNTISTATNGWDKAKLVTNAITNTRNSKIRPQSDYHVLLDGRIVTVIYDKLVVIDPKNTNNPTLAITELDKDKWIESWSFDSNESLFFKARNGTEIKKVVLDKDRNNTSNPHHVISPYYNLEQSPVSEIKSTAASLILYNVYGYIGQIMLINTQYQEGIDPNNYPNEEEIKTKQYGLAVAITNNASVPDQGDTKGLLNTENAFQKSADFTINQDVLKSKLPSEITREDISFLNNSFLTKNSTKNQQGNLLYEPFVKNSIDDNAKQLQLTLHLDQIPWFVTDGRMPDNIVPLKITKTFTSGVDIKTRFSWKNVDVEDYDFKNTLPTKITIDDIERVSPFVSSLTSQRVTMNNVSYPSTTYKIKNTDDTKGTIEIEAEYKYLPMELKADTANLKTYTSSQTYNIFKSGDSKKIEFIGGNSDTTDIGKVPELKEIKESNVLPSSFVNSSKQEYLKFIDVNKTTGYPLEKIKITATADDNLGKLTITIDPKGYDTSLNQISKTYTGLNKNSEYTLNFVDDKSFEKIDYLPSEINEEIFYQHFVTFKGFDSSDFDLTLYSNDVNGTLTANIVLMGEYPNGPTTGTDFKKEDGQWVAKKTFSGFKNIKDFNEEYQIQFKKDGHTSLANIQKLTPAEIENKLKEKSLVIGNITYTSVEQLSDLFILSRGNKMPSTNVNNSNVSVKMYINNGGGEITWAITYNNLDGYPNPITFLETINGFVKGNEVATNDVLTFMNNSQLKSKKPSYFNMLPSQIKEMLDEDKTKIKDFFLNEPTGGYAIAMNNNDDYKVTVFADDSTGNLSLRISFTRNNTNNINEKSLLEYEQMYTGLMFN